MNMEQYGNKILQAASLDEALPHIWHALKLKTSSMIEKIGDKSPHVAGADGQYDDMRYDWWTSGFWPGLLWVMYDMTKEPQYKQAAWSWDDKLERKMLEPNNFHHDVGFQFLPTAVLKYKLTGDEAARRKGLFAANFLAGRFNLAGQFLRAWNQDKLGWSIVDSSLNLSLLFWASEETQDPRFSHIAKAHASTVVQYFIRADGSVNHIVSFDPESGSFIESLGGQGADHHSSWSRGQAWALYGMANTYRYTGDSKFLHAAQRVAHYFIACLPEDYVPHWDFRASETLEGMPRDTSAAACAASGLIELAQLLPPLEGSVYLRAAQRILLSLSKHYATWKKLEHEAILLEGTGHYPAGQNVNVSLIYGDYYYVEAIAKLRGWSNRTF